MENQEKINVEIYVENVDNSLQKVRQKTYVNRISGKIPTPKKEEQRKKTGIITLFSKGLCRRLSKNLQLGRQLYEV